MPAEDRDAPCQWLRLDRRLGFLTPWKAFFVTNFPLRCGSTSRSSGGRSGETCDGSFTSRDVSAGPWLAFGFAATTLLVGIGYQLYGVDYAALRWAAAVALSISLLHYWYDGFVWSVRKREVSVACNGRIGSSAAGGDSAAGRRCGGRFRDRLFGIDPRALAWFRICIGGSFSSICSTEPPISSGTIPDAGVLPRADLARLFGFSRWY